MNAAERLQRIAEEQSALRRHLDRLDAEVQSLHRAITQERETEERTLLAQRVAEAVSRQNPPQPQPPPAIPATPPALRPPAPPPAEPAPPASPPAVVETPPAARLVPDREPSRPVAVAPLPTADAGRTPPQQPAPRSPEFSPPPRPARAPSEADLEMQLGQVWFVRIGIAAILTGLVLASVYAYKNFVHAMPPLVKVLALYAISAAITFAGLWLERSRESLRAFGRVVTGGGMAAVFYTTFAMHYVDRLRVVQSPLLAGLLLLLCAAAIFVYSDVRRDRAVAVLAMVLGYYGTSINPLGWFSLFANLVLTAGGLTMLWRHRWLSLGVLSLIGCYGGFAFWQYALPFVTTGRIAPVEPAAAQGFLLACWVLFTAAFLLAQSDALPGPARAALVFSNNGAFFSLFLVAILARTPAAERADAVAWFAMIWGPILLALAWAVERRRAGPSDARLVSETFLACGLLVTGLGCAIRLSGYQLGTVLAFEAAALAWLADRQGRRVAKAGAALAGLGTVLLAVTPTKDTTVWVEGLRTWSNEVSGWREHAASWLQAAALLLGGWWTRGRKSGESTRPAALSGLSLSLCMAALVVVLLREILPPEAWWNAALLLVFSGALLAAGARGSLDFTEMRRAGSVGALLGALIVVAKALAQEAEPSRHWGLASGTASALASLLLVLAWQAKREPWLLVPIGAREFSVEAFAHSAAALLTWALAVLVPVEEWWQGTVLLLTCGALSLAARLGRISLPELAAVARLGGLAGAAVITWFSTRHWQTSDGLGIAGATLNLLALVTGAWIAKHRESFAEWRSGDRLAWVSFYYSAAAVLSWLGVVLLPLESAVWKPAAWVLACAAIAIAGKHPRLNLPELSITAGVLATWITWRTWDPLVTPERWSDMGTAVSLFALLAAALVKAPAWSCGEWWWRLLAGLAAAQVLVGYVAWWLQHERLLAPLAVTALAALLAALTLWRPWGAVAWTSAALLALGLGSFLYGLLPGGAFPPQNWGWLVPVLGAAAEGMLRRGAAIPEPERRTISGIAAVAAVIALWAFLTYHVLADGSWRTMMWGALALGLFLAGLALRHPAYRRCGLGVLALALGRIIFYDVWQLETAARFASFIVIGAVLVALGFVYNRFEALLRRYL